MRKTLLIFASFCTLFSSFVLAAPTDVKPHYEIRNNDFWRYLTVDGLPLEKKQNHVKSITFIYPEKEEDFNNATGSIYTYNYNKNGVLTDGSARYSCGNGGYDFKVTATENGLVAKVLWTTISNTPENASAPTVIVTEYIPLFDRMGRLQQIRENTQKLDGKKVNSVHKYVVKPGKWGAPQQAISLNDNSLKIKFDDEGHLVESSMYGYDPNANDWVLLALPDSCTTYPVIPSDAQIEKDSKGNWVKKSYVKESADGKKEMTGVIRKISYY